MKFTCEASALTEGLSIVTKAISSRTTNPILEGILIQTNEDGILLTCSDERVTIRTQIAANVTEHGQGVVPGKLFSEIARRLSETEISVTMNERFMFRVASGNSRTNIAGQDADLFPRLPELANAKTVSLPQSLLQEMIKKTSFAIASDDMREALTGGYLEIKDGGVTMVALDGFRLALRCDHLSDAVSGKFSAIIPGKALTDIAALLDGGDEFVQLSMDGNKMHFALPTTDIYVILIAGEYIDYNRIIPKTFGTTVTVPAEPFRRCVERAALIAREGQSNLLLMKFEENRLVIEAHSQIGDVREELETEQEGGAVNIAFNVRYVMDVVRFIDAENLRMRMNDSIHPCVVSPADSEDYIHLVLPVRTSSTVR